MAKQIGPEAKIISLFAALSGDSKRIVLDVIKSQSATPRKAADSRPARQAAVAQEPAADKDLKCGVCGNVKNNPDHDRRYLKSRDFEPSKSVARAPRKSKQKKETTLSTPSSETEVESAGNAALAVSGGSSSD